MRRVYNLEVWLEGVVMVTVVWILLVHIMRFFSPEKCFCGAVIICILFILYYMVKLREFVDSGNMLSVDLKLTLKCRRWTLYATSSVLFH